MRLISIQRQMILLLLSGLSMFILLAGCDGDSTTGGGGGGGGCVGATCFGGGSSGGGGGSRNPNLSISIVPGDGENTLTLALTSGSATSFNIYWSTSPDTTTPTWTKIENVQNPFTHTSLTNGTPIFYGATAVSGGNESAPSEPVGGMPGRWTELSPSGPPPARDSHTAVYVSTSDRMIVFGGKNETATLQDLWILSDVPGNPTWIQRNPSVPPDIRAGHTAVYNKQTNKMIVFAGSGSIDGTSVLKNDLWSLSNADAIGVAPTWQLFSPAGLFPIIRWGHAAVYDENEDIMIVFGGAQTGVAIFDDIWVLDGATTVNASWREIPMPATGGPSARCCMAVGYDSENRRMILFGGSGFNQSGPAVFGDLWTLTFNAAFTTAAWQELTPSVGTAPSARCCAASVWDGSKFLLFGGGQFNSSSDDKIYALVLGSSTFASAVGPAEGPTARTFPSAVPAGLFLLFGGADGSGPLNDLWRLE